MAYTSDNLVTEVRRRSRLPTATDLSDAEILQYADQEMQTTIADVLRNTDASYWVATLTTPIVAGTSTYDVPRRAIGAGLERVEIQDSNGNRQPVVAVSEEDTWRWAGGGRDPYWAGRFAFTMEGEALRLWPAPTSADTGLTLRVRYQRQPSRLVTVASCAAILEPAGAGSLETESAPPATMIANVWTDIVRGDGVYDLIATDLRIDTVVGTTVTFTGTFDPDLVADQANVRQDYLALAGETCFPQIPTTLWPLLVSKTVVGVLEALGDREGMAAAQATATQREAAARSIVTPRSREVPRIIARDSYLRRGFYR